MRLVQVGKLGRASPHRDERTAVAIGLMVSAREYKWMKVMLRSAPKDVI